MSGDNTSLAFMTRLLDSVFRHTSSTEMSVVQQVCCCVLRSPIHHFAAPRSRSLHTTAAVLDVRYGAKARQQGPHWYNQLIIPWKTKEDLAEDLIKTKLYEDGGYYLPCSFVYRALHVDMSSQHLSLLQ